MKRAYVDQVLHLLNEPRGDRLDVPPALVNQGVDPVGLVLAYRANRDVVRVEMRDGSWLAVDVDPGTEGSEPACRCYRCGTLLTVATVVEDEERVRPVCGPCSGRDKR